MALARCAARAARRQLLGSRGAVVGCRVSLSTSALRAASPNTSPFSCLPATSTLTCSHGRRFLTSLAAATQYGRPRLSLDPELEQAARLNQLRVSLEPPAALSFDGWMQQREHLRVRAAASHYAVFEHAFGKEFRLGAMVVPVFEDGGQVVYCGNRLSAANVANTPTVTLGLEPAAQSRLAVAAFDLDAEADGKQRLLWLVSGIENGDVASGTTVLDYTPPAPTKESGFHRVVFAVFDQANDVTAKSRVVDGVGFQRQNGLNPLGLAFCNVHA
eukprot:m.54145 g.54145  ORF g.54145 m.54145 type:complete len:273 (+) comp12437_c0_seq1:330-1148(+)